VAVEESIDAVAEKLSKYMESHTNHADKPDTDKPDVVPPSQKVEDYHAEGSSVNSPPHYNSHTSGVECIDIIEVMPANIAMSMKYLWREGLKPGEADEKDLEKSVWYTRREISLRKMLRGVITHEQHYKFLQRANKALQELNKEE